MCGIAGMFQRNGGQPSLETVNKIGLTMTHRGPDNFGIEQHGKVVMAHNRLSLLDLSDAANQPFSNSRYSLIYNGEIYNFRQLREELIKKYGIEFVTTSDTEVLFHLLIHEGIDECLSKLQGMFAFAFYDEVEEILLLARDRMGIKPLYYYSENGSLYWASEIKALVKTLGLKPDPIRTLFSVNNMAEKSAEYTLFKNLWLLTPGSYLRIESKGEPKKIVYYDVVDEFDDVYYNHLNNQSSKDILTTFDGLFVDSVQKMLISDAPVGAFVSGGIDSSLISAVAAQFNSDIKLFTANIVGKYSEYEDVVRLSKHINKEVFAYEFQPQMMLRDWADVTYSYDCPIVIHVNSIPFSNVARLARDSNVKAVLTGEGADELFLGYPRIVAQRYSSIAAFPVNAVKSVYDLVPKLSNYLFPHSNTPVSFINKLVQGFEFQQLNDRANIKLNSLDKAHRKEQYLTINMLREHLITLLHRNDRMGMMSSIEARFPFLDEAIVKFAVNLPTKFKIGRTGRFGNLKHPFLIDKWIVRKMSEKYLPKQIVRKKKYGFPMYGHKYLRVNETFFRNGWIAESLGLSNDVQKYFLQTQDPYMIGKLASVEIFGRIFGFDHSTETVKQHIYDNAKIEMSGKTPVLDMSKIQRKASALWPVLLMCNQLMHEL
ncbi:MAG: asparagine synthase (glutamine-hydrolyzing) [Chloracidobacterium sp.]|nr:asparagine synthase (glutamine-hydrolyzing) [Chloracidobacterium sp.]